MGVNRKGARVAVHKDQAVVVRSFDLGEADRIITFCAAQNGRLSVIARGARKPRSRLAASLQLFNIGELVFFKKANRDLHYINTFDVSHPFGVRMRDPLHIAYASHLAQTADAAGLENNPNPDLFNLLRSALSAASGADSVGRARRIARSFEAKLLNLLGYRPRLGPCVVCGSRIERGDVSIGLRLGGALCKRHERRDQTFVIGEKALNAARRLSETPFAEAAETPLGRREQLELKRLYLLLLSERLERKWTAAEYIDALENGMNEDTPLC